MNQRLRDGYMNLHSLHSWQLENPRVMREERSQYQFKISYWTGIINGKIIGAFELPGNLTGQLFRVPRKRSSKFIASGTRGEARILLVAK